MTPRAPLTLQPRLMKARDAATYLGVSQTTLLKLELPRRTLGGLRLFDRFDLDAYADSLPYECENDEASTCDEIFGLTG